jgi:hypothetical protein
VMVIAKCLIIFPIATIIIIIIIIIIIWTICSINCD